MKALSKIAEAIQPSTTMAIDTLFKQMKASGMDVIGFGAGEPDFNTPDRIKAAGISAIEQNETRYTPAAGTTELRQAVCSRMQKDLGLTYTVEQVVVTSGAKHAVYATLRALINPGDEVLLPAPFWVSYLELIQMAGGIPILLNASEAENFKISAGQLAAAVTPKTKALILNNPSNPTGMVYDKKELQSIADVCAHNEIYVIADEIYCNLLYDGAKFTSFPTLGEEIKDLTILINGVSKSYAMTGWRMGYACAGTHIAKVMANYLSHSTGSPCSITQKAALEALSGRQNEVEMMRRAFEERRNYIVERMNQIPGVSCIKPQGAFYVMMNLRQLLGKTLYGTVIHSGDDFASVFLKKGLVAVVPGTGFGAPDFVRWSYATSMENIREGLDRLERFLEGD